MQESMEGAIAAESEFHCCNSKNHSLVFFQKYKEKFELLN